MRAVSFPIYDPKKRKLVTYLGLIWISSLSNFLYIIINLNR
jgi:hypothetical protein